MSNMGMIDDRRIVMLKHSPRYESVYSAFYKAQCDDLSDRVIYDVTSRNPNRIFAKQVSPMYMGPVITGDSMNAECFEIYWQSGKLYPCHAYFGKPTADYWGYRKQRFSTPIGDLGNVEKRYPNRMLHCQTKDCQGYVWYNKETRKYEILGWVASRKKAYICEYAKLFVKTDAYQEIKKTYESGKKIALIDFDVYNYYKEGKTIFDVINENRQAGHGYVIKMLLEGAIEVVDGEVVDYIGILEPRSETELNFVTFDPGFIAQVTEPENADTEIASNMTDKNVTPELIETLESNQIFVFGSNLGGKHIGGAAKFARERFGAVNGKGEGLQGQSYAIPTMFEKVDEIKPYVDRFLKFADDHQDLQFLVTRIGCGIAGFKDEQIAPLFAGAGENVILPRSFRKIVKNLSLKL